MPAQEHDLAFGHSRACARTADDGVACWAIGDRAGAASAPERVGGLDRVHSVAMSIDTLLVAREDGSLWRWDGAGPPSALPLRGIQRVDAFAGLVCVIDRGDHVGCWGEAGNETLAGAPQGVPGAPALVDVHVGFPMACGLTAGGDVWCWDLDRRPWAATRIPLAHPATALAVAGSQTCAVNDGAVDCWGSPMTSDPAAVGCQYREYARGGPSIYRWEDCPPHRLAALSEVVALTIAHDSVIVRLTGGAVVAWQADGATPLGDAAGLSGIAARGVTTGLELCGWSAVDELLCLGHPAVVPPNAQPGAWSVRLP